MKAAVLCCAVAASACGGTAPGNPPTPKLLSAVEVQAPTLTLTAAGQTVQLTARARYSDGTSEDVTTRAVWSSSAPALAVVSGTGVVTAVGGGTATISARFENVTGSAVVGIDLSSSSDWSFLGAIHAAGVTDTGVYDLFVDPRDDRLLYAAGDRGLFTSRDRGASWTQQHVTTAGNNPGVLAPDPRNPDRVLYGVRTTLFVSEDRGGSWQLLDTFKSGIRSVQISSLDSRTIYVGLQGPDNDGIYKSTDAGLSWEAHPFGYPVTGITQLIPWDISEDPVDGTLYVPTELHDHPQPYRPPAFRSIDGGLSWQNITGSLPWHGTKIVVHPGTREVFFLTEGAGLYRSADQGLSWARHGTASFASDLLIDPREHVRWFGGEIFFGGRRGGVYMSTDGAQTFVSFGLDGRSCGVKLSGDSRLLFAHCYNSGVWVRDLRTGSAGPLLEYDRWR